MNKKYKKKYTKKNKNKKKQNNDKKQIKNVKQKYNRNKHKQKYSNKQKRHTLKRNKNKKQKLIIKNKLKQKGGHNTNSELCNKDINDLLVTSGKIFKYNRSGNSTSVVNQANMLSNQASSGWGSNPGPPPNPDCVIS
jgi:hypothetical protein